MPETDRAKSNRLRTGRCSGLQQIYLITTTTYSRLPIFRDFDIARLLVNELKAAQDDGWALSLAWVVMPDHLHWLAQLQTRSLDELLRYIVANPLRAGLVKQIGDYPLWRNVAVSIAA